MAKIKTNCAITPKSVIRLLVGYLDENDYCLLIFHSLVGRL